jgi:thioredoxin-dependent peroxiredoxin
MVELRKRKPKEEAPAPPPKKKSGSKAAAATAKVKGTKDHVASAVKEAAASLVPNGAGAGKKGTAAKAAPKVGDTIDIEGFGGEVETHDGKKTSLKQLLEESKAGVVIFTYPKASTPGCKYHFSTTVISMPGLSHPMLILQNRVSHDDDDQS